MLFNTLELINLIKINPNLINAYKNAIIDHRKQSDFNIINLIKENLNNYPFECLYFIIYSNANTDVNANANANADVDTPIVISTARLIFKFNTKLAYINQVYTNKNFRNKKYVKLIY